jgi:hypothetical protein
LDLFFLGALRWAASIVAFIVAFYRGEIRPEYPFDMHRRNGVKKSREELEQESLEQTFFSWLWRYISRPAFPCELVALFTALLSVVKCLFRMNLEIGLLSDVEPVHPLFWMAISFAAIISVLESAFLDSVCKFLGEWGHKDLEQDSPSWLRRVTSNLSIPLLSDNALEEINVEEAAAAAADSNEINEEDAQAVTDISSDTDFKAKWSDLLSLCVPDAHLICVAFVFLLLAASAQVYIPTFTGNILDALAKAFSDKSDDDGTHHESITDVPGFMSNVKKLIVASILGGVFSGCRGSIFTLVGGRVNVRLRIRLMDSLLVQDIGFFDITKTGEITSRLSSDTTLVSR